MLLPLKPEFKFSINIFNKNLVESSYRIPLIF